MNLDEKKAYVLSALEKFSARTIDKTGKGANIKRIDKLSERKIEELYQQVVKLERQKKTKSKKDKKEEITPNWVLSLQDKIWEIQHTLDLLVFKVSDLDTKIQAMSLGETKPEPKIKQDYKEVLGFRIVQKWVSSGGKRYLKWYGVQQKEGKQVWVYLGDNPDKAEEKIKESLKKQREMKR